MPRSKPNGLADALRRARAAAEQHQQDYYEAIDLGPCVRCGEPAEAHGDQAYHRSRHVYSPPAPPQSADGDRPPPFDLPSLTGGQRPLPSP